MLDERTGAAAGAGARRVALISLLWTATIAAAKLTVGVLTGSVAVLGDGFHSALDVVTSTFTLAAVRIAARPPDAEHPYGHGRAENLAALGSAGVMALVGAGVAVEAARRLAAGTDLHAPWYALAVAAGAIVVDAWRAVVVRRAARRYRSPALAADAANFTADIAESAAVLAGLAATRAGVPAADPVAAFVVVAAMWVMAGRIGLAAVHVLMDRQPDALTSRVVDAVRDVGGVISVGEPRLRRSGPDIHAEVTVGVGRTTSVERSHEITEAVEEAVAQAVPGARTIVHVEPSHEGEDIVARTLAAADRVGMADQVHNVLAIRHPEGLWLMLHAKVPAATALGPAHEATLELERELRTEVPGLARVEIHLEPHEPRYLRGSVVSAQRGDLVAAATSIAEAHPPISRCHEVAVSRADDGYHVVMHCEADASTSIADIHDASLRAESEIHRRFADVRSVTVHFEPQEP